VFNGFDRLYSSIKCQGQRQWKIRYNA
jgi:hypothetical protein